MMMLARGKRRTTQWLFANGLATTPPMPAGMANDEKGDTTFELNQSGGCVFEMKTTEMANGLINVNVKHVIKRRRWTADCGQQDGNDVDIR
jgi:hypothetical protein